MQVADDKDNVCQVCKDMVQQARNLVKNNQTENELKLLLKESCAQMKVQVIIKECDNLVDQFIPELNQVLLSQINPTVFCSVSGLCNSAYVDEILDGSQNSEKEVNNSI